MWPCGRALVPLFQSLGLVRLLHTSALDEFWLGWVGVLISRSLAENRWMEGTGYRCKGQGKHFGCLGERPLAISALSRFYSCLHWLHVRMDYLCVHCLMWGIRWIVSYLSSGLFLWHPRPPRAEELCLFVFLSILGVLLRVSLMLL